MSVRTRLLEHQQQASSTVTKEREIQVAATFRAYSKVSFENVSTTSVSVNINCGDVLLPL